MYNANKSTAHFRMPSVVLSLLLAIAAGVANAATLAPNVAGIGPASAYSGQTGFNLTLTGANFTGHDLVQWNGVNLSSTTFVSSTQLTGRVNSAQLTTPGVFSVTVVDASGNTSDAQPFTVVASPSIAGVQPSAVIAGSKQFNLTVTGANFASDSVITWNGSDLTTTVVSPSELQATVGAARIAAAGTATIGVTSATAPKTGNCTIKITAAPVAQILKPAATLANSPAFTLSVTGANFTPDEVVTWNGSPLPTVDISATQLSASVDASLLTAPSAVNVGAVNGVGAATAKTLSFSIQADPSIAGISPKTAVAGALGFTLTVNGAHFTGTDIVNWNGAGLSTTYVSATQMTAHVGTCNIPAAGTATITVVAPGSIASNGVSFTITDSPSLSSIAPSSCIAGVSGLTVTLHGANFTKDAVATWNRSALPTTWISASELTATVTAAQVATPQTANIAATSSSAPSTQSLAFIVGQAPILSNIVPTSALAASAEFTLTVNGGQFSSGYTVTWNGSPLTTTFVSASQLTAAVPAKDIAAAGSAVVAVTTPAGISSATKPFTVNPDPTITAVSPGNVPSGTPGVTLTINGLNFTGSCTTLWNGSPINTVFVSANQLKPYVPASLLSSPASANVVVQLSGVSSNIAKFTIDWLPTLTQCSPSSVNQGGPDDTVTLTGSHFVSGCVVQWNGTALATTFVSATSLSAVIPAADTAAAGIGQITVENPDSAVTAALPFRVLVVSNAPLWDKPLVWSHYTLNYTYSYPTSGTGLYNELYPLDMSSIAPKQSPAIDIQLAQAEGVDAFAVEIVLDGAVADPILCAADAAGSSFYVAPSIDLSTVAGQSPATIEDDIVSAVKAYAADAATHPSAARDNGNLVIWTFDSAALPNANWKDAINRITADGINTTWVADIDGLFAGVTSFPATAITSYLGIFQSGYIWSAGRDPYWDQTVALFQSLGHDWCGSMRPGSISPTQYCDAQATALMRSRWQRNLTDIAGTQWVDTVTWNDYSESSGINPASTWNMTRPDLNAYFAAQFQGRPAPNPNAELYVTSPQAINLGRQTNAEAMVINPTGAPVTADIQLFDGNGVQIGSDVTETVAATSVDAATVPIELTSVPAGGFFRANAIMRDGAGNILQSVLGAPTIVYPAGTAGSVNVIYYSIPAYNALPGVVGLTLSPNGVAGQATATVIAPSGTNVKFAELLYNTQEAQQFFAATPTTQTVSTTGPGFFVARVTDQNRRVGYSNPIYVGP